MAELSNLALMTPELIVLGGALLLMMWGVFRPETEREAETIGWGAVVVLFVAGFSSTPRGSSAAPSSSTSSPAS